MSEERYEIVKKIGQGGIGAVYKARDIRLDRDVAIKRLLHLDDSAQNKAATADLKREASTLSALSNPHIVTVYDADEDEDGVFVVMELIKGKTLDKIVRHAALPFDDFVAIAEQALDGLIAAHDHNLLHRDIKPKNIMVSWHSTGKFQLKILDFGLAKFSVTPSLQTLDQNENILGSVHYMAPEQFERRPLDVRVDLYSLGCVLYFSLAQDYAFRGDTPPAIMNSHLNHVVTPLHQIRPDVPQAYADWVMRLISRDPEDRPATALAALEEFRGLKDRPSIPPPEANSSHPATVTRILPAEDFDTTGQRAVTAPLNTARLKTGHLPTDTKRFQAGATPSSALHQTSHTRSASPARSQIVKQAALITAGIVVLLGGAAALINAASSSGSSPQPKAKSSVDPATHKKKKTTPTSVGKSQNDEPKPDIPVLPLLPKQSNLVGHYIAGFECYTDKGKTISENGDLIRLWGDLSPNAGSNNFYRPAPDENRSPVLTSASGNGLKETVPVLNFDAGDLLAMTASGLAGADPTQGSFSNGNFSFLIVYRTYEDRPRDRLMAMDSTQRQGLFRIEETQDFRRAFWPASPKNQNTAKLDIDLSTFVILCYSCNPNDESHRLRIRTPDGELRGTGDRTLTLLPYEFERFKLGGFLGTKQVEGNANLFAGLIAELLIYDTTLSMSDCNKIESYLLEKYFEKR
ncbi:MAG: serine/threonine-protein kinase [Verrucomicrobiota bacterium]